MKRFPEPEASRLELRGIFFYLFECESSMFTVTKVECLCSKAKESKYLFALISYLDLGLKKNNKLTLKSHNIAIERICLGPNILERCLHLYDQQCDTVSLNKCSCSVIFSCCSLNISGISPLTR